MKIETACWAPSRRKAVQCSHQLKSTLWKQPGGYKILLVRLHVTKASTAGFSAGGSRIPVPCSPMLASLLLLNHRFQKTTCIETSTGSAQVWLLPVLYFLHSGYLLYCTSCALATSCTPHLPNALSHRNFLPYGCLVPSRNQHCLLTRLTIMVQIGVGWTWNQL